MTIISKTQSARVAHNEHDLEKALYQVPPIEHQKLEEYCVVVNLLIHVLIICLLNILEIFAEIIV